jgi:hypothetical protein
MIINRYKILGTIPGKIYHFDLIIENKWYFIVRILCFFGFHKYDLIHSMLNGYQYCCYRCDKVKKRRK